MLIVSFECAIYTVGGYLIGCRYRALGGLGFILGDGRLNYDREAVNETYYTAHVAGGLYMAAQLSVINNPGYNRGPVVAPGVRAHIDF